MLLDQTVAAGIGNVVRCEALYALRVDPWAPLGGISDETLTGLLEHSRRVLQAGVRRGRAAAEGRLRRQALPPLRRRRAPARTGRRGAHRALVPGVPDSLQIVQYALIFLAVRINANDFAAAADTGSGESAEQPALGGSRTVTVNADQPITCLIADDHEVVREGLRLALSLTPNIRVVGEAADGEAPWPSPTVVAPTS